MGVKLLLSDSCVGHIRLSAYIWSGEGSLSSENVCPGVNNNIDMDEDVDILSVMQAVYEKCLSFIVVHHS